MVWAIKIYILDVTRHVEVWGLLIARYFMRTREYEASLARSNLDHVDAGCVEAAYFHETIFCTTAPNPDDVIQIVAVMILDTASKQAHIISAHHTTAKYV